MERAEVVEVEVEEVEVEEVEVEEVEVEEVEAGRALADAEAVALGLRVVSLPLTIQTPLPSVQHVEPLVPMPQHRLPSSQAVSSTSLPFTLKPQGLSPAHQNTLYQPHCHLTSPTSWFSGRSILCSTYHHNASTTSGNVSFSTSDRSSSLARGTRYLSYRRGRRGGSGPWGRRRRD